MRLVILLLLAPFAVSAQLTYYIRSDTVKLMKSGGNNELILQNGTRGVNGILTNVGNGRTQFIGSRKSGDTLFIGVDTLLGFNSGQRFGVTGEDTRATATRSFSMGGNGFSMDSAQSILFRSRGGSMGTRTHLIQSSGTGTAQTRIRVQSSTYSTAFAQIAAINTDEARPSIQMTVVDTSINGTSMILKGDTLIMSIDGSTVGAPVRYIMENMPEDADADTTTFKPMVINTAGDVFKFHHWPSLGGGAGVTDHGALTGLPDDDHTQYALLAGRTGGQVLKGGDGTTDDLILQSTSGIGATGALIQFKVGNNGATTAMTVLNNGNVGIGNTNPAKIFHAAGPASIGTTEVNNYTFDIYGAANAYLGLYSSSSGTASTDGFQFGHETTGNYFIGRENVPSIFYTNNSEKMRIEAGGNVGIGDASPASLLTVGASDAFQVNSLGKLARYAASAWTDGQILIGHTANGTAEKAAPTNSSTVTWTLGAGALTANIPTSFITDSTYTPTLTNTTNISASVANANTGYYRVGNSVTVYGTFTVTPTAELTACEIGFSLPIASAIAASTEGGGAGSLKNTTANRSDVSIDMDATNDRATFSFMAPADTSPITLTFSFTYRVTPP